MLEKIIQLFTREKKKEKVTWVLMRKVTTLGDYKNPIFLTDNSVN